MSKTITKYDRETIVKRAIKHAFEKRDQELLEKEYKLAEKVHASLYVQEKLYLAEKLGSCWVTVASQSLNCYTSNGRRYCLRVDPTKKLYLPLHGRREEHIEDEKVAEDVNHLSDLVEDLKVEKRKAEGKLNSMLLSLNTPKRLLDSWPEGKPFYSDLIQEEVKSGLPAIRVAEINDIFGLNQAKGKKHA